jgi:hypothetical protein
VSFKRSSLINAWRSSVRRSVGEARLAAAVESLAASGHRPVHWDLALVLPDAAGWEHSAVFAAKP